MSPRPLLPRADIQARLQQVFPREAFDTVLANPLAAAAVAAMLYIDAVAPDDGPTGDNQVWARPTTCLWMSDAAYGRDDDTSRASWRAAAAASNKKLAHLVASWGESFDPWYADNTRETLRDETFPHWLGFGAVRDRPGLKTTSSSPRWALTASFAGLFAPTLTGQALDDAIEAWRDSHMAPPERLRIRAARDRNRLEHAVPVTLPDGTTRQLEPGPASHVIKGVIEQWVPTRLADPVVLTISEPGRKIYVADQATLDAIGLHINASTLLPDLMIVDVAAQPPEFWIVEAIHSDGPINEDRRHAFLRWAEDQRIPVSSCRFLSAFTSRHDPAARRRLKDLATNTYAWYADEPTHELAWYEINSST